MRVLSPVLFQELFTIPASIFQLYPKHGSLQHIRAVAEVSEAVAEPAAASSEICAAVAEIPAVVADPAAASSEVCAAAAEVSEAVADPAAASSEVCAAVAEFEAAPIAAIAVSTACWPIGTAGEAGIATILSSVQAAFAHCACDR